jgi:uncharacterized repeat protein (TIGR04076 family)
MNDSFNLFNLEVTVVGDSATFVCSHKVGHAFRVEGENLIFNDENDRFSFYSLSALLPLLAAKQRKNDRNDWMSSDEYISCPDPHCGAKFKITRDGTRNFSHKDVTKEPIKDERI